MEGGIQMDPWSKEGFPNTVWSSLGMATVSDKKRFYWAWLHAKDGGKTARNDMKPTEI